MNLSELITQLNKIKKQYAAGEAEVVLWPCCGSDAEGIRKVTFDDYGPEWGDRLPLVISLHGDGDRYDPPSQKWTEKDVAEWDARQKNSDEQRRP